MGEPVILAHNQWGYVLILMEDGKQGIAKLKADGDGVDVPVMTCASPDMACRVFEQITLELWHAR